MREGAGGVKEGGWRVGLDRICFFLNLFCFSFCSVTLPILLLTTLTLLHSIMAYIHAQFMHLNIQRASVILQHDRQFHVVLQG